MSTAKAIAKISDIPQKKPLNEVKV